MSEIMEPLNQFINQRASMLNLDATSKKVEQLKKQFADRLFDIMKKSNGAGVNVMAGQIEEPTSADDQNSNEKFDLLVSELMRRGASRERAIELIHSKNLLSYNLNL